MNYCRKSFIITDANELYKVSCNYEAFYNRIGKRNQIIWYSRTTKMPSLNTDFAK